MRVQLVGIVRVFVILIALASLAPVSVAAQPSSSAATSVPRTPDGRPDLQGVWDFGSVTSLQRPASLAGKEFLTEEDVSALEAQAAKGRIDRAPPPCATAGQHRRLQPVLDSRGHEGFWDQANIADIRPTGRATACQHAQGQSTDGRPPGSATPERWS